MRAGYALLALALCLLLTMQIATLTPVSGQVAGEWTGEIDGEWSVVYGGGSYTTDMNHQADFSFNVNRDGSVSGEGTLHEEYHHTVDGSTTCDSSVDATFSVSGYADGGKVYLQFSDFSQDEHFCDGIDVFSNYRYNVEFDLADGAVHHADMPQVFKNIGSGDGQGTLIIHGKMIPVDCPNLTITPTMPPASDPRNLAGPTDTASYRFEVDWEGTNPVSVYFDVVGGSGTVSPSFAFNPANMQSSPISVLMDVATDGAEAKEYVFYVDAWVIEPDTGEECHAEQTIVTLVVGESRAADLDLIKRVGEVEITQEETDAGSQKKIKTGSDGLVKLIVAGIEKTNDAVSATTIDVGSNTAASEYDHVDHFAKVLDEKAKAVETPDWIANYFQKYKQPGVLDKLKELVLEVSTSNSAVYSCLFAPIDSNSADLCGEHSIVYVSEGDLHIDHRTATGEAADRLMAETENQLPELAWDKLFRALATPNALIIPEGTELTVDVEQSSVSSTTSVTLLEGSAIVVDLASEKVRLVNAGQRYSLETSVSGQTVSSTDRTDSVTDDSVTMWWQVANIEVSDFGTAWDLDFKGGDIIPINDTPVFFNTDERVWAWIEFLNVPAHEEHIIDFRWYGPDGTLAQDRPEDYITHVSDSGDYWGIHPAYDVMVIAASVVRDMPGKWTVQVYYDGDFVKEIPFYTTKNTLIKDQSVTYEIVANVVSGNEELNAFFENGFASGAIAGVTDAEINGAEDIEWLKTTIVNNSAEGRIQDTVKLKDRISMTGEPRKLSEVALQAFIPTIGIDDLILELGFADPFPSEATFDRIVDLNIGGSKIKAFEFSGNKKFAEGDSSSDITITSHYEKDTGILLDSIISGSMVVHEVGKVELELGVKATEVSIPTTITLSNPSQVQQNQAVSVSGTLSPPISEGQVLLTYKDNNGSGEPIKRTVAVTNGAFSDSYMMEKDGTYAVSAEYLGSGAYLSSTAGTTTLTVVPSGCLIATAAFGSELTPQVQFLRNFRDNHILSTAGGSSFMNVFNAWYYSFSPKVADYEREQPWLQQTVKTAIYPLLGILTVSEGAYASMQGEYGAVAAGIIASSMIGAVYFWPAAFALERFSKQKRVSYRVMMIVVGASILVTLVSVLAANPIAMMVTTSFLVLAIVSVSALSSVRLVRHAIYNITKK